MRPIRFQLGPLPIRSYGVMMMLGFLIGLYRAVRAGKKRGIDPAAIVDICLYSLLAGVIGSRLVFILLNWAEFRGNMGDMLSVWQGGLSFHGGVIFAVAAAYGYTRIKRLAFWEIADLLAPSLALAYAVTRIGCFLNGCCFGVPTNLPWGARFPNVDEIPRHPTQLYSFAASLLIYLALVVVEKWNKPRGHVFASYIAMYSVYRFLIEIPRKGALAEVMVIGLTQAQVVSVVTFICAAVAVWRLRRANSFSSSARSSRDGDHS